MSGCAECAALHHDLRAITAALPTLPAPARPRDFRLTPGQAASLRPTGWRRLLGTLAGPSFRLAAPVGTGLAALGLAGILVGSLGGIPLGMGGAASGDDAFRNGGAGLTGPAMASAAPSPAGGIEIQAEPTAAPAASGNPAAALQPSEDDAAGTLLATPDADRTVPPLVVGSVVALLAGVGLVGARLLGSRLSRAP
ncbi:MAG: hypothetical protein A2V85_01935 [Chloroflexi bacterium RBG_16_72_14]|nr:MAG: hypothetical protein A2V85_01935 [Chloroflexi bacterium RBG_16_72_14]